METEKIKFMTQLNIHNTSRDQETYFGARSVEWEAIKFSLQQQGINFNVQDSRKNLVYTSKEILYQVTVPMATTFPLENNPKVLDYTFVASNFTINITSKNYLLDEGGHQQVVECRIASHDKETLEGLVLGLVYVYKREEHHTLERKDYPIIKRD